MALLAALVGPSAFGEDPLGDVARRERQRREKAGRATPAGRVYTNDDLEAARASTPRGNLNVMEGGEGWVAPAPGGEGPFEGSARPSDEQPADENAPGSGGEAAWRERAVQARGAVESAERAIGEGRAQVESLQEQLSPMAQPYVLDPNQRLRLEAELTAAQKQLQQAEGSLEAARQAYRQLLDDARRQRIPPGWISNAS